jgi:CubicO group peptidase (beta-lactamase class C family)
VKDNMRIDVEPTSHLTAMEHRIVEMDREPSENTQRGVTPRSTTMKSIRHIFFVLAVALLLPAFVRPAHAAPAPKAPDMAAIDRYVAAQLETLGVPGASLAVVHGDEIVHLQGFGRADSAGRAMTPQTPTMIGSLTKSFTAVAIMQLVEQGRLELDAPVQRYLPWFRVADPAASARITIRHLLTHTSGLPGREGLDSFTREDTSAGAIERLVRALASTELTHPVGSTNEYANVGYSIAGLIVETVSGQSYEEYVQEHIFTPLGMEQSYPSPDAARPFGLAEGHQFWFGQARPARLPYPRGMLPAGYLASSAEDMGHYLIAHLGGGRLGEAQILSPESMAELHRPGFAIDEGLWAGLGWGVADVNGVRVLQHSGNTNNYRSEMWLLPESGWGFVLLLNADNQFQRRSVVATGEGVTALLLGQEAQPVDLNPMGLLLYGIILSIAGLELLGIARGVRTVRRWQRVVPERAVWRQVVLPLMGHALVTLLFLVLIPTLLLGGSLSMTMLTAPDLGTTLLMAGALALGWGLLRTILALHLLRRPRIRAEQTAAVQV